MVPKIIEDIRNTPALSQFLVDECCEEGANLILSDSIDRDRYEMIKVDAYYNSLNTEIPKSVDCLIVHVCPLFSRILHLIELKSYSTSGHLSIDDIIKKFRATIDDFIENRFYEPIGKYNYHRMNPVFISKLKRRDKSQKLALLMAKKNRIHFRGTNYTIQVKPNGFEIVDC
ncbi:MAG: hypothetical protein J0L60_10890 [Ignavibacteria bacterium]|nr:hypothetical protein [Ignavibacteria bacterium]